MSCIEWKTLRRPKEYSYGLIDIVNKIRLLRAEFKDARIVEKILITVLEIRDIP